MDPLLISLILLAVASLTLAVILRRRELHRRGNCPACGAGSPELVGEWDGEMYRCRECGHGWDELKT